MNRQQAREIVRVARITGRRPAEILADDAGDFLRDLQVINAAMEQDSIEFMQMIDRARAGGQGVSGEQIAWQSLMLLLTR